MTNAIVVNIGLLVLSVLGVIQINILLQILAALEKITENMP